MVNLRYHIVSIVAVFLALGVGVIMGSTVVDRGIVDVLNRRVDTVERNLNRARDNNRRQNDQLRVWTRFGEQARDQVLQGRLKDVPVLLIVVRGVEQGPVNDLRHELAVAQTRLQGTLWLEKQLRLTDDGDTKALAAILGVAGDRADSVRQTFIGRMAALLAGTAPDANLLSALQDANFTDLELPSGAPAPDAANPVPAPGTRYVIVSGAGAQVADGELAVPLTQSMALSGAKLLAAEAGRDSAGGRAVFVGPLRTNNDISGQISTLDNLESYVGQTAAILVIEDLAEAHFGHFGVGPDAQQLLPAVSSP